MVLVVSLVLVERKVLVDVLNVGCRFVGSVITFSIGVVVGRVALRVVNAFVAFEDGSLTVVEVVATIVVIVVVGRV